MWAVMSQAALLHLGSTVRLGSAAHGALRGLGAGWLGGVMDRHPSVVGVITEVHAHPWYTLPVVATALSHVLFTPRFRMKGQLGKCCALYWSVDKGISDPGTIR